ncbi:MAG: phosphatase PAP2 family protein [Melioribacteraceae bacterium]|nr:phosphatase PAP2 family protein [Melioribacteraceae bacterium]
MLELLNTIDIYLFYFINHTLSNPLFDKFFPFITDIKHWYLVYVIMLGILWTKGGRIGKISILGVILLITFSDQLSSNFLKHYFERIRPCVALDDVNLLVGLKKSFSFPSSHAVNNFAVAIYFVMLFPKMKWILPAIAFLIAFSRPYIGVHYPFDILAGGILGVACGYLFAKITLKVDEYFENRSKKSENESQVTS